MGRVLKRYLLIGAGIATAGVFGLAFVVDRFGQVDRASPSPIIVVLGARVLEGGSPSPTLQARVEKAVALYRRGLATRILFSGGVGRFGPAEALVAQKHALAMGVPADACLVETGSHSTQENARLSAQILKGQGISEAVLVSDPYHLLRARGYFAREGIRVHPSPASSAERNTHPSERLYWTLREAIALAIRPWLLWA